MKKVSAQTTNKRPPVMKPATVKVDESKPAHSKIGASSMHRWAACPGSVKLCEHLPSRESEYAKLGTKAHELAADMLNDLPVPADVDPEMYDAVLVYVQEVNMMKEEAELEGGWALIEHRFDLSEVMAGLYGTADAVIYYPKRKLLRVVDYKHGAGVPVSPFENEQLQYYALGALISTNVRAAKIECVIIQPRIESDDPVKRWEFDALDILDFEVRLREAAEATMQENAPLVPGDHCRFCPANGNGVCKAVEKMTEETAVSMFRPIQTYNSSELSEILNRLDQIEDWAKKVREFAYTEAMAGRAPDGFKLVSKRAHRKWMDERSAGLAVEALGFKRDSVYTYKLKTPAQVEKIVGKDNLSAINAHIVQESTGLTLVPVSDKRPEERPDKQIMSQFKSLGDDSQETNSDGGPDWLKN